MEQLATFGAGCFWSVELLFAAQQGVTSTSVGYMGGHTKEVNYNAICKGDTGHAEVVQVTFDDSIIDYSQLLEIFWKNHNPTTPINKAQILALNTVQWYFSIIQANKKTPLICANN
jgi:peptide-methionine (S)-S-oxide reductase